MSVSEVTTYDEAIERIEAAFWRRYNANPDVQRKLAGKDRDILIDITDGPGFHVVVRDGKIAETRKERIDKPDVRISLNERDFFGLFDGSVKPLEAYMSRRVKVKAGFKDLLFAKSLLGW